MLDILGVGPDEQDGYEHLVRHKALADGELGPAAAVIGALQDKGLARRLDDGRYAAVSPDLALRGLAVRAELELGQARTRIAELAAVYTDLPREPAESQVEFVPGSEAIRRFQLLHLSAREEVRAFESPPYSEPSDVVPEPEEMDGLSRGVRYRVVYGRAALEEQSLVELSEPVAAGEQARVVDRVPLRLLLVDRDLAITPARTGRLMTEGLLVVRPGALLDALSNLFELVWQQALPLQFGDGPVEPADDGNLVALLSAGLGDQTIARYLGVGLRTVQRRIQQLMSDLHATTRFQAGVVIGRRPPDER